MDVPKGDEPLQADEREELARLREEVAALHGDRAAAPPTADAGSARRHGSGHRALRWTAATLLLILVVVLSFSAVLARFARSEVLDTDRYVQTVTPLAANPTIQANLANRITNEIMSGLDVEGATTQALQALTENAPRVPPAVVGLAPVIADQAQSFVHKTVASLLATDEFETLWVQANKDAHQALVAVLTGDTRDAIQVSDQGAVSISLAPIIDKVRDKLTARGFAFADKIPTVNKSFVLFQSPALVKAQGLTSALNKSSDWLPWLALLVAAGAIWAAPKHSRRRAFTLVGVSVAVAMALLAVAISIGRSLYLGAVPADVLNPQTAEILIDTVLLPLRTTLRAVFALALAVSLAGYVTGSSRSAVAIRGAYGRAMTAMRAPKGGRAPHPIESAALKFRAPLRGAIIAIAVLTLVFWKYPSGVVVVVTILIAVAVLFVVEVLARPALTVPRSDAYPGDAERAAQGDARP